MIVSLSLCIKMAVIVSKVLIYLLNQLLINAFNFFDN
ncbi:hypothetical protein J2X77_000734 [Sphingobacterium sp. 2149]|nr:hypothetical protein [Sphingobacterium sp. 2149]